METTHALHDKPVVIVEVAREVKELEWWNISTGRSRPEPESRESFDVVREVKELK